MQVTICTPTYNRKECLKKAYNSLLNQTAKDFEWLIIDDGSQDHTDKQVEEWKKENKIEIRYYLKENGGKHTALNIGIQEAKGKYFCILDSDDHLVDNAVEEIIEEFSKLEDGKYAGVGFNKIFDDGKIIGTTFRKEYVDATSLERKKYNIDGDKAEVFYTEIIKKYPFPVFDKEKFMTEAIVWNRIAHDGYLLRWVNKPLCVCEYRADGLSASGNAGKDMEGYSLFIKELLKYSEMGTMEKIKWLGVYSDIAMRQGWKVKKISAKIETSVVDIILSVYVYRVIKSIRGDKRSKAMRIERENHDK